MDNGAKKTQIEQRVVIGLAVVFVVVFITGPMKNFGWLSGFGGDRPAPAPQEGTETVDVSRSIGVMLRERWEQLTAVSEPAASDRATSQTSGRPMVYTAATLRDPMVSLLPQETAPEPVEVPTVEPSPLAMGATDVPPSPPPLQIQGLLWGTTEPKAIIDGDVYGVGDTVNGVTIRGIDRSGVTIDDHGAQSRVSTEPVASQQGPWR